MKFVVFSLLFVATVFAWDQDILKRTRPKFVKDVDKNIRNAYTDIAKNKNTPYSQQDTALDQWAQRYQVVPQWDQYKAAVQQEQPLLVQYVNQNAAGYNEIASMIFDILNDRSRTREMMKSSIDQLSKQNKDAVNEVTKQIKKGRKDLEKMAKNVFDSKWD